MRNRIQFASEEAWLKWRSQGIGASDVPSIMGEGFSTPYELWKEKLGMVERKTNARMALGKKHEADAMALLSQTLGIAFEEQVALMCKAHPFLRCTLDGLGENCIAEVKCIKGASKKPHHVVQKKYYAQVQLQLYISKAPVCYYAEYDIDTKTLWIDAVKPDKKYMARVLEECAKFWECVQQNTPPELTEKEKLEQQIPEPSDVDWGELEDKYLEAKKMLSWAKANVDLLEEQMVTLAEEKPAKGKQIALRVSIYEGAVDYESIRELRGVNLSKYRKSPTKRFAFSSV